MRDRAVNPGCHYVAATVGACRRLASTRFVQARVGISRTRAFLDRPRRRAKARSRASNSSLIQTLLQMAVAIRLEVLGCALSALCIVTAAAPAQATPTYKVRFEGPTDSRICEKKAGSPNGSYKRLCDRVPCDSFVAEVLPTQVVDGVANRLNDGHRVASLAGRAAMDIGGAR